MLEKLDPQIMRVVNRLGAKLSIDRPLYPEPLRTFEERRIDWLDNGVHKAIIIQPTFELAGVNAELWNFTILAWDLTPSGTRNNSWVKKVIHQQDFCKIENGIVDLLNNAVNDLEKISKKDLVSRLRNSGSLILFGE